MAIFKILGIIFAFFLVSCVKELCRVFGEMPDNTKREKDDRSYVAVAIVAEVILIGIITIKVITG